MKQNVFITGGTGYMGSRLIPLLSNRGHEVSALVRQGSEKNLKDQAHCVAGDPLKMDSYTDEVRGCSTFVHLIGVPHPSPAKAAQFRAVDLVSIQVAAKALQAAGIRHFVYLSVAHPAPVMKAYIEVRSEGERLIRSLGLPATSLRPWYVLGPGHRWPYLLLPVYWLCERSNWITGNLDFTANRSNWDVQQDIAKSPMWTYCGKSAKLYKCPADHSQVTVTGQRLERVRSMSMSQVFANGDWLDGSNSGS